jgi:hypothetical protein
MLCREKSGNPGGNKENKLVVEFCKNFGAKIGSLCFADLTAEKLHWFRILALD